MAFLNPSNQLLQIDTGSALTYYYNASQGLSIYKGLGENQVVGQRYFSANYTIANPNGAPAIYMLVTYKSTATPAPVTAPAPVYWTDTTYTTVSGVESEGAYGLSSAAGFLMVNTTSVPSLTATLLNTALVLIQVAGPLSGAIGPASTVAGDWIFGAAGNWLDARSAAGTHPGYQPFGIATSSVSGGLINILLNCDII